MAEIPSLELTQSQDLQPTRAPSPDLLQVSPIDPNSAHLKTWGDFQLLQCLGHGGFGEVFRAWDPVLEREVALKLLLPSGLDLEQQFARLIAEARAIARVRHPNIVSVYGADRREGRVGFWSDYIRGQTLSALVAARGPVSAEDAARICIALCEALASVHTAGLLHRDIKPGNAMRDETGRVVLMDFGLSQDLLGTASLAGTPGYLAPEFRVGQPASVQSDIYAMGILLRFLVTGSSAPDTRSALPSQKLADVISRSTDPDPKLRYVSAEQMATALNLVMAAPAAPQTSKMSQWRSVRKYVVGISVLLFIFVPRLFHKPGAGAPAEGTPAFANYLAANEALLRYDKPGNTDKAIDLYLAALKQSPTYALAEAGLSRAYWRKYDDTNETRWADDATQAAARAVAMNPDLAAVQMTIGMIHVNQGKFDVGMQELQQALKDDLRSPDAHAALAEAYRQQGRIDDAKKEFQAAMDLDPDNWFWPYLLGALQIDSGDIKSAEQNLNTALAKTPDNVRVLYNLGIVYTRLDRLADAQNVLEKALGLGDRRVDPINLLGKIMIRQGQFDKAVDLYRRAVQVNPSAFDAWGNLGIAYGDQGQHSEHENQALMKAITLAEDQVKRTPEDAYLVSLLGKYYALLHDQNRALTWLRKAIALAPNDPAVVARVGESYETLGNRSEAINLVGKALKLGYSVDDARSDPALKELRRDPNAPPEIRESSSSR